MKVAFAGKGGTGKTTVSSLFIRMLGEAGRGVLAVDCDPDSNLGSALGFEDADKITPIIEMQDLIRKRMGISSGGSIFKLNPKIDDIPEKFSKEKGNIKLIVMGSVKRAGSGCACPENAFMKSLMEHLVLRRNEDIVMDMEAGIEHMGRATAGSVDTLIAVLEPSTASIETAKRIKTLAGDIGLVTFFLANKIRSAADEDFVSACLKKDAIIGMLPYDDEINLLGQGKGSVFTLSLEGNKAARMMAAVKEKIIKTGARI